MNKTFSSAILKEKIQHNNNSYGKLVKHFDHAPYAIQHFLHKIVPKGGVICAIHSKSILARTLAKIAKEKNCKIININGTKEATEKFLKAGVLAEGLQPDIYLTEPEGFTQGGAIINPDETEHLNNNTELIGVGSALQWTKNTPANYDFIPLTKIVSELGIHKPEHLEQEINASFFSLLSS